MSYKNRLDYITTQCASKLMEAKKLQRNNVKSTESGKKVAP